MGLGLTEPRGGSDAANLTVRASRSGNGYRLSGEKTSMSFSVEADAAVVFARTGPPGRAHAASRPSWFISTRRASRVPALKTSAAGWWPWVGVLRRCPRDVDVWLGEEGKGFTQVMQGFDYSRALIGLQCVAAAQASLDETWAYVQGARDIRPPLAQYQGVTFPLAEDETQIAAARQLCYHALRCATPGPHTAEAAMASGRRRRPRST